MASEIREVFEDGLVKNIITTEEGIKLVGTFYDSELDKGVFFLPGFTEHRSSFNDYAEKLSKNGIKSWTFDINSQGESSGDWNLVQIAKGVYEIQKALREKYGLKKIGALGNSIGGMAVGLTAAKDNSSLDCICLTTTPAGLQDVIPKYQREILKHIPQSLVRYGTIVFDKVESGKNKNYREKSHLQFKTPEGYQPYAQFGALKIKSLKNIMGWIENAPRLDEYTNKITQPVLFVYGGEDKFMGVKNSKLPSSIQKMVDNTTGSREKKLLIAEGADHSINSKTRVDEYFNQDSKYIHIKTQIINHFNNYLL